VEAPEDREFVMDIQAWYKDFLETHDREVEARVLREFEAQRAEELRQAETNQLVHQFEHRLGRRLTTGERGLLTSRVESHGSAHLADLVLDLSGPELAVWFEQQFADARD